MQVSEAQLIASISRKSFKDFVREFVSIVIPGKFRWNWHIDVMCDELQEVAERVFAGKERKHNLVCNISPGTTKSTIFSVLFPAWVWIRMPSAKFICVSYAENLALDLSRRCRDVVMSEKYQKCFPEIELREDQSTKSQFGNTKTGMRYAAGTNGTVQGFHGDFIIIDDPLDPNRAVSEIDLTNCNYWVKNTLSGRYTDKVTGVMILVMQRLACDDPTALLTDKGAAPCRWLRIPATTEFLINPPELARFYTDGLMDPVGLPKWFLDERRGPFGMGESMFAGQYGEDPVPLGGGVFKTNKLRWGPIPPKFKRLVRGWDKAVTPEKGDMLKGAAFSVGVLGGEDLYGNIWLLDVKRKRMDSYEREEAIKRNTERDGRGVVVAVEQEPGAGGKDSALATMRRLKGYKVILTPASGSKEARADAFSYAVNGGIVYIPEHMREGNGWRDWAKILVDEMMHWPHSTYLDQVDACATMFNALTKARTRVGAIKPREEPVSAR